MASQDWHTPETAARASISAYELRPLSVGEVLDRTFSIYRSRFWLFAGISALSGSVQLVTQGFGLFIHHLVLVHYGRSAALVGTEIVNVAAIFIFLLATAVTQAATVYALSEVYLGRIATVGLSLKGTIGQWYRYLGIALWQTGSMIWVALLLVTPAIVLFAMKLTAFYWLAILLALLAGFGGLAYGFYAYLRNSLGVQIAVVEQATVRSSMRRSKFLSNGAKGRVFLVLLIAAGLFWVAGMIQFPFLILIGRSPLEEHVLAQGAILLVSFFAHTLVSPVALIGLSLVYFDQRVRKEAFDLLMLLGPETTPQQAVVTEAVYPVVASPQAEVAYPQTMSVTDNVAPAPPATVISEEDAGQIGDATKL